MMLGEECSRLVMMGVRRWVMDKLLRPHRMVHLRRRNTVGRKVRHLRMFVGLLLRTIHLRAIRVVTAVLYELRIDGAARWRLIGACVRTKRAPWGSDGNRDVAAIAVRVGANLSQRRALSSDTGFSRRGDGMWDAVMVGGRRTDSILRSQVGDSRVHRAHNIL